ncbi:MAG: DUF2188 domain-containing protein [Ilumatobacteraceae bacterium]
MDRARDTNVVYVCPHPDGWALAHVPAGRPVGVFLNRQFAIRAGQALAVRAGAQLVVHGPDGSVDAVVGAPDPRRARWWSRFTQSRRRRTADVRLSPPGSSTECLLDVHVPYDSWCLRVVRTSCERVLAAICPRSLLEEAQMVVTELVLQTTLRTRRACRLTIHLLDHEILIEVRSAAAGHTTEDVADESTSAWARFDLRHGTDIETDSDTGHGSG